MWLKQLQKRLVEKSQGGTLGVKEVLIALYLKSQNISTSRIWMHGGDILSHLATGCHANWSWDPCGDTWERSGKMMMCQM